MHPLLFLSPFLSLLPFAVFSRALEVDTNVGDDSPLEVIGRLVKSGAPPPSLRLLRFVGKGSSGRVYKAAIASPSNSRSSGGDALVAVKVIPLREEKLNAIKRELQILSRLGQHSNVVKFHGAYIQEKSVKVGKGEGSTSLRGSTTEGNSNEMVGDGGKYLWIVMQWIEGIKLGHVVDRNAVNARMRGGKVGGALSVGEARSIGRGILGGLSHLHNSIGCAHGDVDVSNVMLVGRSPILIDMGNGKFEKGEMGEDCLRVVYAIVEMTMTPLATNAHDDGPVNIKEYGELRKRSVPLFLHEVAEGKFGVPDEVRELVRFAVHKVRDDTKADELLEHPFFSN